MVAKRNGGICGICCNDGVGNGCGFEIRGATLEALKEEQASFKKKSR